MQPNQRVSEFIELIFLKLEGSLTNLDPRCRSNPIFIKTPGPITRSAWFLQKMPLKEQIEVIIIKKVNVSEVVTEIESIRKKLKER